MFYEFLSNFVLDAALHLETHVFIAWPTKIGISVPLLWQFTEMSATPLILHS